MSNIEQMRRECEAKIKYIQRTSYKFEINNSEDKSNAKYYRKFYMLLSSYINFETLYFLDENVFRYINRVHPRENTIRSIEKHCNLKTLGLEEQFVLFHCLLDEDNFRTLLELSMKECDTITFQSMLALLDCSDFEKFKEQASKIHYSASRVSRIAQAICVVNNTICWKIYKCLIKTIGDIIKRNEVNFISNLKPLNYDNIYCYMRLDYIVSWALGLNDKSLTSYISNELCFDKNISWVIPTCFRTGRGHIWPYLLHKQREKAAKDTTFEQKLPKLVDFRKTMLEEFIAYEVHKLEDKSKYSNEENKSVSSVETDETPITDTSEKQPETTSPTSSESGKNVFFEKKPTNISTNEEIDAFCKVFASYCIPNDSRAIYKIFWNKMYDYQLPEHIEWKSGIWQFVAFIHYAYKGVDLPHHTSENVKVTTQPFE